MILVIDSMYLLYRSHYVGMKVGLFSSTMERSSGHIYYTLSSISKAISQYKPTQVFIAMDLGPHPLNGMVRESFEYGSVDYKGNRNREDETVTPSLWRSDFLEAMQCLPFTVAGEFGYEADDVIYSFVKRQSSPVVILSRDYDLSYLLNDRVKMTDGKKELVSEDVCGKFKIKRPRQISLYKAVRGDTSDNIPRVPGFSPSFLSKYPKDINTPKKFFKAAKDKDAKLVESEIVKQAIKRNWFFTRLRKVKYTKVDYAWNRDAFLQFLDKWNIYSLNIDSFELKSKKRNLWE